MRRGLWILGAGIVLLLVVSLLARQQLAGRIALNGRNVIFHSNYRLADEIDGDLVVVGDSLTLESGSRVTGDVSLIGSNITVTGTVEGDLTLLGENLTFDGQVDGNAALMGTNVTVRGSVGGDLRVSGDRLTLAAGTVGGLLINCAAEVFDARAASGEISPCPATGEFAPFQRLIELRDIARRPPLTPAIDPGVAALGLGLAGLGLVGFSTLVVAVFPLQISRIEDAIRARPRSLSGVGFAVFLLVIGLLAALIVALAALPPVGLLLIPVYLVAGLALGGMFAAGLVTLALVFGEWLLRRLSRADAPPLVMAAVGSLALALLLWLLALLPYGGLIGLVGLAGIGSVGLGAALFTRLGTRPLRRSTFVQG
jgi:hypothetical protein